jgi:hypothetical protein
VSRADVAAIGMINFVSPKHPSQAAASDVVRILDMFGNAMSGKD